MRPNFEKKLGTRVPTDPTADAVRVPGSAVAILKIPRIHLDMVVVEGTDTESLKKGPGHYTETAYPWQDHGRVAIAGHRTTYLHPFYDLNEMREGDPVIMETVYGTFRYVVTRVFVITPGTSAMTRLEIRSSTSSGRRTQSAVMASSLVTARITTGCS